ncbi:MAG: sigma-70 family RNA polymerase sigma factor [Bacteroidia bacterium]|nr:sigma-70 family RNA polymerase sigma factor [Bacteroidia bacterium]MDW8158239.1 sigma-70 family RNA polymerase sigma factor [Bacteroidia bacterium]
MEIERLNEQEIVMFILKNDPKVVEYVYKKMYPPIGRYILMNNGTPEEAQDTYQDAFITLYQKIQKGNLQLGARLQTILFEIAKRLWLKRLREKKYSENSISELQLQIALSANQEDDFKEVEEHLISLAMQELCEKCRQLLRYFYYERKKFSEFYKLLGFKSISSAKNKKVKCMKSLKEIIQTKKFITEKTSNLYSFMVVVFFIFS